MKLGVAHGNGAIDLLKVGERFAGLSACQSRAKLQGNLVKV